MEPPHLMSQKSVAAHTMLVFTLLDVGLVVLLLVQTHSDKFNEIKQINAHFTNVHVVHIYFGLFCKIKRKNISLGFWKNKTRMGLQPGEHGFMPQFPLWILEREKMPRNSHILSSIFLTIILPPSCSFSLFSPHFPPPRLFLSVSPLTHAVRFFSLIHQYTIVQRLPFSDANYLPKWGCEALCLPAQSFIDRSVS